VPVPAFTAAATGPLAGDQRDPLVDTLRAFALFGVIVMNVVAMEMAFAGDRVMATAGPLDRVAGLLDLVLLQGKARAAFAFLFGVGFGVLLARAEARGDGIVGLHLRRMGVLLLIGVVDAALFFWGDILLTYALLGMTLPWFRHLRDRTLAIVGAALVLAPPLLQGAVEIFGGTWPAPHADHDGDVRLALAAFASPVFDLGVVAENLRVQWALWWMDPMQRVVYVAGVLGLFLLGLVAARRGLLFDVAAHRPWLRRVARIGVPLGLALSVFYATPRLGWTPAQPWAGLQKASMVGLPMMALGLIAWAALWLEQGGDTVKRWLAPAGRLALSGYLASNLAGALVFHGYGLGLMGQLGLLQLNALALAMFAAIVVFARLWLRRFRYGPAEWLWRRASYERMWLRF
jgi:uncharacterized protein